MSANIFGQLLANKIGNIINEKSTKWVNEKDKDPQKRNIFYYLLLPLIFTFLTSIFWIIPGFIVLALYGEFYGNFVMYITPILVYLLWFSYIYKRNNKKSINN